MRVQDVYSPNAVHILLSCTLQEAIQQMRQRHVGALVVTGNTPPGPHAIGVVTDRGTVFDAVVAGVSPSQTCVADAMSWGILNVPLDANPSDASQEMLSSGVRCVGVTPDGALVGVLSLGDAFDAMVAELGLIVRLVHNEHERETTGSVQPPLGV